MRRASGILSLLLLVGALAVPIAPVGATEEESPSSTETTVAATTDIEPAVSVTTPVAAENAPDWTYRYLIPTGILLAGLIALVTTVQYFVSVVRKRYRLIKK